MRGRGWAAWVVAAAMVLGVAPTGATATADAQAGDPLRDLQWGLEQVRAPQAWERSRGEGAAVAVLSTGVQLDHPDLAANLLPGRTVESCADAPEGCGDGGEEQGSNSMSQRGTEMAGIIAAVEGNGQGIAGVAPDAKLIPVRTAPYGGLGQQDAMAAGIRFAADAGAQVAAVSYQTATGLQAGTMRGIRLAYPQAVEQVVRDHDLVVVQQGGGTSGADVCADPVLAGLVVCVTASDRREVRRNAQVWGDEPSLLAVTAPGGEDHGDTVFGRDLVGGLCEEDVITTAQTSGRYDYTSCATPVGYGQSTSVDTAIAHVAGVAALLRGMGCTGEETRHLLKVSARNPLTGARGEWSPGYGYGIVDAEEATRRAEGLCVEVEVERRPECVVNRAVDFRSDALPEGWTVATAANADGTPSWSSAGGPRRDVATTDASGLGAKDDALISAPFLATSATRVAFSHRFALEAHRDGGVLESSVDDGATWSQVPLRLFTRGGYNAAVASNVDSAIAGRSAWTGTSSRDHATTSQSAEADLGHLAGKTARLRWRLVQDGRRDDSTPGLHWSIDRVRLAGIGDDDCRSGGRVDALIDRQWGLAQVRAEPAWQRSRGQHVTIAVIDSGVDFTHPDLADNVVPGITFLGCGAEGCGNGGWDSGPPGAGPHFHGTYVAGIAAAVADNGIGIAGVAPEATILPIRMLHANGGSASDAALGVRWAADNGAQVVNMSLGNAYPGVQMLDYSGVLPGAMQAAVEYATSKGVVVVAAAGNDPFPVCSTPGVVPGVICVTATDRREAKAAYSNLGNKQDQRSVSAPGGPLVMVLDCDEDVLSTVPPGTAFESCAYSPDRAYDAYSGTSAASPHVAGVAALLRGMGCTVGETVDLVQSTSRHPLTHARGSYSHEYGWGIVDAEAATAAAEGVCDPANAPGPPDPDPGTDPGPDPQPPFPAECAATWHGNLNAGLPPAWSVETAVNEDGTGAWRHTADPYVGGWELTSQAHGLGRKDDSLVTDAFRAGPATTVEFRQRYVLEDGRDGGVLEWSDDDGVAWQDVAPAWFLSGGYNGAIGAGADSPIAGRPAWTGVNSGYRLTATVDLSALAGRDVRLRWRLVQDALRPGSVPGAGWWLSYAQVFGAARPQCLETADCRGGSRYAVSEVPAGWSVETTVNVDGTATWRPTQSGLLWGTLRSEATGTGAKDDRLVTAPFRATRDTVLSFGLDLMLEPGRDGLVVEVSADDGDTWAALPADWFTAGGYNGVIDTSAASPIAGRPAFTGSTGPYAADWRIASYWSGVHLGSYAGQDLRVRWRLVQDAGPSAPGDGAGITSVLLHDLGC